MFSDGGNVCSNSYPESFGFAAVWDDLPIGGQGQVYSDGGCTDFIANAFGPGGQCWKSGGQVRAASINWFHEGAKRTVKKSDECAPPTAFHFTDPSSGKEYDIAVGSAEAAKAIGAAWEKGDYATLATYPQCKCPSFPLEGKERGLPMRSCL